jgi:hypothetical protein
MISAVLAALSEVDARTYDLAALLDDAALALLD